MAKEKRIRDFVNTCTPEYWHIVKDLPDRLDAISPDAADETLDDTVYDIHICVCLEYGGFC